MSEKMQLTSLYLKKKDNKLFAIMKQSVLLFALAASTCFTAWSDEAVEVLKQRQVADGVTQQAVRNANGFVYKRYVGTNAPAVVKQDADETESTDETLFYEGFEGYATEGTDLNWIPSTWSKKIAPGNEPTEEMISHNINNTWYCYYTGDGKFMPITTDGQCDAFIHYGYADSSHGLEPVAQDEWLISPTVQMAESGEQYLDFLLAASFFDCYDVTNDFDWGTMTFKQRVVVNNMKVMASDDDGETWAEVFNLADDVLATKTDRECYDTELTSFNNYKADVSEYAGKQMKFAFRYERNAGDWIGNSMVVDGFYVKHKADGAVKTLSASADKVAQSGRNIIVSSPSGRVAVYAATGMKMGEYVVESTATIDAAAWNAGVYIVRFADGKATKVIVK